MAKERRLFTPVTKCPDKNDKWYTLKANGGLSPCIPGKPQAWFGSDLANCVGNAWSEFAKRENNPNCKVGCYGSNDYPGDAWTWYQNSIAQGYEVGTEPKLGAVAVWKKTGAKGHVAMVEKIYKPSLDWDSSESGYKTSPVWFTKHYNKNAYRNGYTFLGYIYPKYEYYDGSELEVGDKVQIIAKGNTRADGKGNTAYGINYKRYIISYQEGKPYPYQVGLINPKTRTTGYYKAEALKKL